MVSHVGRDRPAAELNANHIRVRGQRASHGVARCITRHPQFDDEISGAMFAAQMPLAPANAWIACGESALTSSVPTVNEVQVCRMACQLCAAQCEKLVVESDRVAPRPSGDSAKL